MNNFYHILILLVSALQWKLYMSIPIDNGVEGEPEVQCGAEGIEVTFRTR